MTYGVRVFGPLHFPGPYLQKALVLSNKGHSLAYIFKDDTRALLWSFSPVWILELLRPFQGISILYLVCQHWRFWGSCVVGLQRFWLETSAKMKRKQTLDELIYNG